MSYMTISSQENHHFSLCSYFHAHPTTLLLKILGGTNAWAVPHLKFWGPSPPVPLGLRPCYTQSHAVGLHDTLDKEIRSRRRPIHEADSASRLPLSVF